MLSSSWAPRALQVLMDAAIGQDCTLCAASCDGLVCADCAAALPALDDHGPFRAAFAYAFPVDRLVHRFKSGGDLAIGRWLAERLGERVRREPRPDLLVAPPLSPRRLRERGFNQSLEIARVLSRTLRVPRAVRGVRKRRETPAQRGLGRGARLRNLRGAFECRLDLRGKRVAIVDDVVTTGATVQALAAVLRRAGAKSVAVWCVAHAPRRGR